MLEKESYDDMEAIKAKAQHTPGFLANRTARILIFQTIGTIIFAYGICCSLYTSPVQKKILNPLHRIFVSCSLFIAICWAGRVTAGHMNPAVTLGFWIRKHNGFSAGDALTYMVSQVIGAIIGVWMSWGFLDSVAAVYTSTADVTIGDLVMDTISEAAGTFFFLFFILMAESKDTTFLQDRFWGFLFVPINLYICSTFSFRVGCLNPAIGLATQIFSAVSNQDSLLVAYGLSMVIGPFIGGLLASLFFDNFYRPTYLGWKEESSKSE